MKVKLIKNVTAMLLIYCLKGLFIAQFVDIQQVYISLPNKFRKINQLGSVMVPQIGVINLSKTSWW